MRRASRPSRSSKPAGGRVHYAHTQAATEGAGPRRAPAAAGLRRRAGLVYVRAAVRCYRGGQRDSAVRRPVARDSQPTRLGCDRGNRAAAPALAAPQVQPLPSFLLPGGGGGDADLAHGGRAAARPGRAVGALASGKRQSGGEPRTFAGRTEARHGRWQDHGNGDDHRVADHKRRAAPQQPQVYKGLPRGDARTDYPGPVAGATAQRPGQLLRQQGTGAHRHAGRPAKSENRHHQLPRPAPQGAFVNLQRRQGPATGAG